jgi:hypothetical protein
MPIRPEISLQTSQAPQLDPFVGVERGMKLQQLAMQPAILEQQIATARQAEATSRAAQMTSEAQLPGVRAEATKKQREMVDYPAFVAKEIGAYMDPKTGKLDIDRWVEHSAKNGHGQEALKYAGEQLGVYKQQIDNAKTEQEKAVAANAARMSAITTIGNIVEATPQENRLKVINTLSEPLETIMPGMGKDVRGLFVTENRDKGITTVNNNIVKAARTAGMTPDQQEANKRAFLEMTPEYQAEMANVLPAELRLKVALDAKEQQGIVDLNTSGINSIPGFLKEVKLPGRPGAIVEDAWNRFVSQGGDAAKIQASIDAYNARTGQKLSFRDGMDAVKATLEQENSILKPKIEGNKEYAENGTITSMAGQKKKTEVSTGAAPPPRAMPTPKNIEEIMALKPGTRFIDPRDGKTMRIR